MVNKNEYITVIVRKHMMHCHGLGNRYRISGP